MKRKINWDKELESIPKGWTMQRIEDIFDVTAGGDIDKKLVSKIKTQEFNVPIYANSLKEKGLYGYTTDAKIYDETITVTARGELGHAVPRYEPYYPIVRLLVLKPKKPCDVYFFSEIINSTRFFIEASGVPQLTAPQIRTYRVPVPPFLEQQKIASILATFDKNIQLYTKLIENKKKLKKSLSYKFLNFQDRETRELFDCEVRKVSFSSFLSIPKKVLVESPIKDNIISVKLHRNGLRLGYQNDTLKLGATNYYYRHSGQFIYGKQNIFNGAFDILPDEFDGMYSSADIPSLDINEKVIDPGYFLSYMSQLNVYKKLESKSTGTGSKRLHEKELLKEQIYLPPIEIQRQANYPLMLLTTEIEKLEEMLINLKLQKRGLMQLLLTGKVRVWDEASVDE